MRALAGLLLSARTDVLQIGNRRSDGVSDPTITELIGFMWIVNRF